MNGRSKLPIDDRDLVEILAKGKFNSEDDFAKFAVTLARWAIKEATAPGGRVVLSATVKGKNTERVKFPELDRLLPPEALDFLRKPGRPAEATPDCPPLITSIPGV